jgi:hypothetical protein
MDPIQRLPPQTSLDVWDPELDALIIDAVNKLVKSANKRRARRVIGILTEFRDKSQNARLTEVYARTAGEAFLDALTER